MHGMKESRYFALRFHQPSPVLKVEIDRVAAA
jgi:hypothetical protein